MHMKHVKKGLAFLLAVALLVLFVGCQGEEPAGNTSGSGTSQENGSNMNNSGSEEIPSGTGAWIEKDLTPEGLCYAFMSPVKMDDGSLVMYGKQDSYDTGQFIRYSSMDDGLTWTQEELDWEEQTEGCIRVMTLHSSGTCFFSSMQFDENEELLNCSYWTYKDGKLTRIEELENEMFYDMKLFNENLVFLSGEKSVNGSAEAINETYNLDTLSKECDYEINSIYEGAGTKTGWALDQSEENNPRIYYGEYCETGIKLSILNAKGNIDETSTMLKMDAMNGTTDENGNYYFTLSGGICRLIKGGTIQEQIMDDGGFKLGLADTLCYGLTYINDQSFLCLVSSLSQLGKTDLIQYEWDPNAVSETTSSIRVYSLYDNSLIRMAIVEFKKSHPEVAVEYEVGMENETAELEDVIRTLNTEIISGNGPDVLIMDGLPDETYVNKGYLADISDAMDLNLLKSNIINPYINEDGSCYIIPALFSVPVLFGDVGDVDQIKTMDDLKEAILACDSRPAADLTQDSYYETWSASERYAFGIIGIDELIDFTLNSSASALIEDGQINHENLTKAMEFIQAVGTYNHMDRYPEDVQSNSLYCSRGDGLDPVCLENGGYEYSVTNHAQYGWGSLMTPAFFGEAKRDDEDNSPKGAMINQPGLVENAYKPLTMLAVSASSKEQEASKAFIATIMSDSVQSTSSSDGNPVLEESLDNRIALHEAYVKERGFTGDMNAFYDNLKTPVTVSGNVEVLRDYMIQHSKSMISGTESLDQAVAGIENDMRLMLEEQK